MEASRTLVRAFEERDLADLARAEQEVFAGEAWSRHDFRRLLSHPAAYGAVLDVRGRFAGYLMAFHFPPQAELVNIALLPEYRGSGLGRELLGSWLVLLGELGVDEVFLDVRVSNDPAIGLYRAFGFEVVGRRPQYYPDGEDALVMKRVWTTQDDKE